MVTEAHARTKKLLTEKKAEVEMVAKLLLEVSGHDFHLESYKHTDEMNVGRRVEGGHYSRGYEEL
jgi:ATP-dependent Zn protease